MNKRSWNDSLENLTHLALFNMKKYRKFMKGVNSEKKLRRLRRLKAEQGMPVSVKITPDKIEVIKVTFWRKIWSKICSIFKKKI